MRTWAAAMAAIVLVSCAGHARKPDSAESAAKAQADVCLAEGRALYDALESEQDMVKARSLFEKSCDLGSGAGCFYLAVMWERGQGGLENQDLSMQLLLRACHLGEGQACTLLATRCKMQELESNQSDPQCLPW